MTAWLASWILLSLIALPAIGALMVMLSAPGSGHPRRSATLFSLLALMLAIAVPIVAGTSDTGVAGVWSGDESLFDVRLQWLGSHAALDRGGINFHVGIDAVSFWLILLTAGLVFLTFWSGVSAPRHRSREFYSLMLLVESGLLGLFCARDLLLFYVFFEIVLVPLYFIVAGWGDQGGRRAAAYFFIYTLTGSILTFAGVLYLAYAGWQDPAIGRFTFDMETLYAVGQQLPPFTQKCLLIALAAGFAVKVPLFPFHTWLPQAYAEAPAAGTVLLAALVSKMGAYGFLRLVLPMLPTAAREMAPLLAALAIVGILYAGLAAWAQADVKRLIAYSSISHLGFCLLGMFSFKSAGLTGSLLGMVNHGLAIGALFLIAGMLEARGASDRLVRMSGLARRMPWLAFFLVFFTLSSIGLPGLNGFVGEFLMLVGVFSSRGTADGLQPGPLGPWYAGLAALGILLSAIYMLRLCERVLCGPQREPGERPADLSRRDIGVLASLAIPCLLIGIWPRPMLDSIQTGITTQIVVHVAGPDIKRQSPDLQSASTAATADPHAGTARGVLP